jgi:hypothetical protein
MFAHCGDNGVSMAVSESWRQYESPKVKISEDYILHNNLDSLNEGIHSI